MAEVERKVEEEEVERFRARYQSLCEDTEWVAAVKGERVRQEVTAAEDRIAEEIKSVGEQAKENVRRDTAEVSWISGWYIDPSSYTLSIAAHILIWNCSIAM